MNANHLNYFVYIYLAINVFSSIGFAKEGFYSTRPESSLSKAWDSSVMVAITQTEDNFIVVNGSGVVAFKHQTNDHNYIGILTAAHLFPNFIAAGIENRTHEIRPFLNLDWEKGKRITNVTEIAYSRLYKIYFDEVSAYNFLDRKIYHNDLALIVLEMKKRDDMIFENIALSPFASDCNLSLKQKMILIGFPTVTRRPLEKQNVPIDQPEVIKKRWSQGRFTGESAPHTSEDLAGTTVDSIPGSSGGAFFNSNGEIVGISVRGKGDVYQGSESIFGDSSHNYSLSCRLTKLLSEILWSNFLKSQRN